MNNSDAISDAQKPIPLLLFAKAPIAGQVKTRLQSHCSPEQAAEIATILLEASLQRVCENWRGSVYISTWLNDQHSSLLELGERFGVPIVVQCEGDLGTKMHHAFEVHGYPMAIMGCDAPHVSVKSLVELHEHLRNGFASIGPSLDGGYYMIGLCESAPALFQDIPWGTSTVLQLTREKSQLTHLELRDLDYLQDVDEWHDLLAIKSQLPKLASYLNDQGLI